MNPLNIIQFVEKKTGKSPEFKFLKEKVIFYNLSTLTLEECQEEMDRNNGHLNLYKCNSLTSLPGGLEVTGDLGLYGCTSLTSLPDGLTVKGYLDLTRCESLTKIGKNIKVGGMLFIDASVPQLYDLPNEKLVSMFGLENDQKLRWD